MDSRCHHLRSRQKLTGTLPHLYCRQAQLSRHVAVLHFRNAAVSMPVQAHIMLVPGSLSLAYLGMPMLIALACRIPVREFLTTIEKLSASDITKAASAMLKTPVSMASLGNVVDIPRYPEMQKRFS